MDSNIYMEIEHLRDLLQKEMEANKTLKKEIEDLKESYITISKKDYPKGLRFYRKPILFELRKEDDVEDQWESFCDDVEADYKEDDSFEICVVGIKY